MNIQKAKVQITSQTLCAKREGGMRNPTDTGPDPQYQTDQATSPSERPSTGITCLQGNQSQRARSGEPRQQKTRSWRILTSPKLLPEHHVTTENCYDRTQVDTSPNHKRMFMENCYSRESVDPAHAYVTEDVPTTVHSTVTSSQSSRKRCYCLP